MPRSGFETAQKRHGSWGGIWRLPVPCVNLLLVRPPRSVFKLATAPRPAREKEPTQRHRLHFAMSPRPFHNRVQIYTSAACPYCIRARQLLDRKGIQYDEIRVDRDHEQLKTMIRRSGRTTVPQVFIQGHPIGGYDDLADLDTTGNLDPLLRPQTAGPMSR